MNILDGFKKLYVAGGGDSVDLENLSDNDRANMHSVIYGDGMGVKLDRNIEDTVDNIAKGGGGGTTDYERLQNKPKINGTTLEGDLTSEQLTLQEKLVAGENITIAGNTISAVASSFDVEVVEELPTSDIKTHTIYFIEKEGTAGNVYDEYMYINSEWEHIGTTEVDLSGYVPTTRTVNGKALSSDISLTASDVGALSDTADVMVKGVDYVTAGQKAGTTLGNKATAEGWNTTASKTAAHAEGYNTTASGGYSHAEGGWTKASGLDSHAEGGSTEASGDYSHAEGTFTQASGESSHAEGNSTEASGIYSHAEGSSTQASGDHSHAEGDSTKASGSNSHAEGGSTEASGYHSHAEGYNTIASRSAQHVFGQYNIEDTQGESSIYRGKYIEIVGNGTENSARSNARTLDWSGNEVLSGKLTVGAAPTGDMDVATKKYVDDNIPNTSTFMVKGTDYVTAGKKDYTTVGERSTAEGIQTTASGTGAHAEGRYTIANGFFSHAEGNTTKSSGMDSHAEGLETEASGRASHAEGYKTKTYGEYAHAEGSYTEASGNYSHAEGYQTIASGKSQHVFGEYNIEDTLNQHSAVRGKYVEIVGNGTGASALSNARTLDWEGNEVLAGKLTIGSAPTADMDVATKKYVDDLVPDTDTFMVKGTDYVTAGQKEDTILGDYSTAEGQDTTASGFGAHAEGGGTTASGDYSHAEGGGTVASGESSHAEGVGTVAQGALQHVFGKYNIIDEHGETPDTQGYYIEIVGNGYSANQRGNARTLDWNGNETLAGTLVVGKNPTTAMEVATKQYVDTTQPQVAYTTTERKIGTYLGKDLYEITYTDVTVPAYDTSDTRRHGTLLLNTLGFNDTWTVISYEGIATIGTSGVIAMLPMAYTTKYESNRNPALDSRTGGIFKFADGWTFFNTDATPLNVKGLTIRYIKEAL